MKPSNRQEMNLTAEQIRLRRFAKRYPDAEFVGFYSCGGWSWQERDYRCVLLAKDKINGRTVVEVAEFVGNTAGGLVRAMQDGGWVPGGRRRIAALCESAACSPKRPRAPRRSAA